ncbi:hypothetical protein [Actinophytocola xinjiangensis]|nr:hypothetical protein [Actinophytocola xinjiangensis]
MAGRITLTLTEQDEQTIRTFGDSDRPEGALLRDAADALGVPLPPAASAEAVLRALMAVGAATVREQILECGYEELAEIYSEVHDADEAHARRHRAGLGHERA